ncbi:MAG: hypothetical protein R2912_07700 [Eubacteriales bacterium]
MKNSDMFANLSATIGGAALLETEYPWEVLPKIKAFVAARSAPALNPEDYNHYPAEDVWIKSKDLPLHGDYGTRRHRRGHGSTPRRVLSAACVLVGSGCVVGNATELKNCILFNRVQVPHYNYVGDSILGEYLAYGRGGYLLQRQERQDASIVRQGGTKLETGSRSSAQSLATMSNGGRLQQRVKSRNRAGTIFPSVYGFLRVRARRVQAGHIYKAQGEIVQRI